MPLPRRARDVALALVALSALLCTAACGSTTATPRVGSVTTTPGPTTSAAPAALPAPVAATSPAPRARTVVRAAVAPNPCAGNTRPQLVTVRLAVQHLWMCARGRLVYSTPVTSGIPGGYTATPTGTFTVQARTRNTTLTLLDGHTYDVRYWIPFQGPLFGFHDSSWQTFPYGSSRYRTDGSHGCVHLPLRAIAFLYRWAEVGATVRIRA